MNNDKDYMNMSDSQDFMSYEGIFDTEDPGKEYTDRLFKSATQRDKTSLDSKVTPNKTTPVKSDSDIDKQLTKHTEQIMVRDRVSYSIAFGRAQEEYPELTKQFNEQYLEQE